MVISVFTVLLTARTLDAGGYGVLNGTGAYVGLFGVLTDLGLTTSAMQRMSAEPEREAQWLGALAGARITLSVVATVICGLSIPIFLGNAHREQLVAFISMAAILSTGPQALMTVFQSRLRSGVALSFGVLQSVIWLGVVIALALTHASVVAFATANIVVLVVIGTLQIRTTRRFAHIAWRQGVALWRPLLRVAIPLGLALVLITIYFQIDSVLLLQIAGPKETGIYSAAYAFLTALMILPGSIMGAFFPVMSAVRDRDPTRFSRLVQICVDLMAAISLPILAVMVVLSAPIVRLLYGAGYARTAGLLPILMIAFVSICYGTIAGFLASLLGLQWRLALYSGIGALANVVLNIVLIPRYGAYGSAWATVITEILTMTLMLSTALLALRLRISPNRLLRTLLLAAGMGALMALAAPLGLFPAGAIGALAYLGGLLGLRIVSAEELRLLRGGGGLPV